MSGSHPTSVVVVGAGSMGVVAGHQLSLAGASVTFLVRPHRLEQLSRPQLLFTYGDNSLTSLTGYDVLTDPADLSGTPVDLVFLMLDGASLRAEAGHTLVKEIGRAFRGTTTGVVLGAVGLGGRAWFLEETGLAESQVTLGRPTGLIHEVGAANLPVLSGVRADLLTQADFAYRQLSPVDFTVADTAPQVAGDVTALFASHKRGSCATVSQQHYALQDTVFPVLAAWELLGWREVSELDPADPTWQLGVAAMREVQRLPQFGAAGVAASEATDAPGLLHAFQALAAASHPMAFSAFNAYHHGGKVNVQDHDYLRDALQQGAADGRDMPALRTLLDAVASVLSTTAAPGENSPSMAASSC
jgi:ketopantoate reductase PanE/ApbA-like protein